MFVYLWYVGMRPGPGTDALSHHDSAWPIGFHKNYKLFFFFLRVLTSPLYYSSHSSFLLFAIIHPLADSKLDKNAEKYERRIYVFALHSCIDFNQLSALFLPQVLTLDPSAPACRIFFSSAPSCPPATAADFVSVFVVFFLVSRHASSAGWAPGVYPSRGWLGLGCGGGSLHLHRLLLRLPQIYHRVLQGDRDHLRRHAQSGVLDLIHHAGCHVCWR